MQTLDSTDEIIQALQELKENDTITAIIDGSEELTLEISELSDAEDLMIRTPTPAPPIPKPHTEYVVVGRSDSNDLPYGIAIRSDNRPDEYDKIEAGKLIETDRQHPEVRILGEVTTLKLHD